MKLQTFFEEICLSNFVISINDTCYCYGDPANNTQVTYNVHYLRVIIIFGYNTI